MGEVLRIVKTTDQLEPTVLVIFGGAGDLTWRKLVPALFDLSQDRSMPADFSVIAARPIHRDAVAQSAIRGQYGRGNSDGKKVPGYRDEQGVAPDSQTETFAALKLFVDNWRWQDVPFYLRTGKRLPRQASGISIQFRAVPHRSFPSEASLGWQPSRLVMAIQPVEGIVLGFQAKYPGAKMQLRPVDMRFSYRQSFDAPSPDGYAWMRRARFRR
jgi:glucose-6-phosphate 1-dehydrogenase